LYYKVNTAVQKEERGYCEVPVYIMGTDGWRQGLSVAFSIKNRKVNQKIRKDEKDGMGFGF